jgi:hypothetical protein
LNFVEVTGLGDPTADARVVLCDQPSQGFVAAVMQLPASDCSPDALGGGKQLRKFGERYDLEGA